MIFEITRRIRKPDNTLEEQTRVVEASGFISVLQWLETNTPDTVQAIKIERSKITNIDVIQDAPPIP